MQSIEVIRVSSRILLNRDWLHLVLEICTSVEQETQALYEAEMEY
jgi:hypothetical protein